MTLPRYVSVLFVLLTIPTVASSSSPYTGQQSREIKSLSQTDIADYLAGRGMGLAKAAELNHYPGPRHVLDAATQLGLTDEQRQKSEKIYSAMQMSATALGTRIVAKERELDELFAETRIGDETLRRLLDEISALQGELRYTHLRAHLAQRAVLTPQQVAKYDALRGYGAHTPGASHKHAH